MFPFLKQRWQDKFHVDFDVLPYDLTSAYFECDPPGTGKRRYGCSRDKRLDFVQAVIALVVTLDGFPLCYDVITGNTSDRTTLRQFLDRIEGQYGKARRVLCLPLCRRSPEMGGVKVFNCLYNFAFVAALAVPLMYFALIRRKWPRVGLISLALYVVSYFLMTISGTFTIANHGGNDWRCEWIPKYLMTQYTGLSGRPKSGITLAGAVYWPCILIDRIVWHRGKTLDTIYYEGAEAKKNSS